MRFRSTRTSPMCEGKLETGPSTCPPRRSALHPPQVSSHGAPPKRSTRHDPRPALLSGRGSSAAGPTGLVEVKKGRLVTDSRVVAQMSGFVDGRPIMIDKNRLDTAIPELQTSYVEVVSFANFCRFLSDGAVDPEAEALAEAAETLLHATREKMSDTVLQEYEPVVPVTWVPRPRTPTRD